MNRATFFVRPCPACGRHARILLDYLGKQVCCRHCGREFTANDPDAASTDPGGQMNCWAQAPDVPNQELRPLLAEFDRHL